MKNSRDHKPLPSVKFLRDRLEYRSSGTLWWKSRPRADFATARAHAAWNARYRGTRAGSPMKNGYRLISIGNSKYLESRIIFHIEVRRLRREETVDHLDQNHLNNRKKNLRACSHARNHMNQPGRRPGGLPKHVYWSKREQKYKVKIRALGSVHNIGTFADLSMASRAAKKARRQLHGRFADHRSGVSA